MLIMSTNKISSALRRLDLSDFQQTIYLSLLTEGQATARTLAARTGMTRPSVYDQLKSLITLNLVVELDIDGKAEFAAADIKYLDALLADKIDRLEQSRAFLTDALPTLKDSLHTVTPKVRFFEGEDGVKQLLKDIMWHDKSTLQVIWPVAKMNEVFDSLFLKWFDERRLKRQLTIESLWVSSTKKVVPELFTTGPHDAWRVLPKEKSISMATVIYDSKVAFISSHAEAFGFIVESNEFAQSEREKFGALWQIAR
jgi:HTH-type transcriptional regulator, sugar sensing transcriptional regulator